MACNKALGLKRAWDTGETEGKECEESKVRLGRKAGTKSCRAL